MGGPLCQCAGCNAWEMVDGAGQGGHAPPQGEEGTHLEMSAVKMCLLGVCCCIPSATGGQQVIDLTK